MDVTELLDRDAVHQFDGFFSSVYRSRHRDGRAVAIKTPRLSSWGEWNPKVLDIWAKCNHPNIVQLIGKATFRGELAAVYEWHEYGRIPDYLKHHPMADPYQLSAQICDGLAYLHGNDIIHGFLYGCQILVSSDGVPRIQLSVYASSTIMHATEGIVSGVWPATELFRVGSKHTLASDVYALGMTILEAITGEDPYDQGSVCLSVHERMVKGELPLRPTDKIPENEAGNAVWDILCKCWSYNPKDRPSTQNVCDVMHTVYQTPDGVALKMLRLKVREDTTLQDLVEHFEKRGLMNYTGFLHPSVIITSVLVADTALANVYRVDMLYHEPVAVKCVKHTTPYKRLKRAARELDCWSSYQHENILPLFGFAIFGEELAMISPWMNNGYVTDYVVRHPYCDRLGLCIQLARAVAYLHQHAVVHGDIKGPNVLISDIGTVQVTDFGVSLVDHQEIEFSVTSSGRGTQRWQAPEILLGPSNSSDSKDENVLKDGDSSKEGDVYALGLTMIEIYTGERPYGSMDWSGRMFQNIISGQLRPSRPMYLPVNSTGNRVWELMTRCWAGSPSDRPTASQVYERLMSL